MYPPPKKLFCSQVNSQLMEAVQQKVSLSQQLDQWQQDVQVNIFCVQQYQVNFFHIHMYVYVYYLMFHIPCKNIS